MEPRPRTAQLARQPLIAPGLCAEPGRHRRPQQRRPRTLRITQRCSLGGIASPVLSNVYLDRLDRYVEQRLLPEYNLGGRRRPNPAYQAVEYAIARARRHGDSAEVRRLILRRRQLPSQDPADPSYRRLRYVRYADDWLLGFAGPRREAEEIKSKIAGFLRDELKLELSQSKTLITHATSQAARFLGYEIRVQLIRVFWLRRRSALYQRPVSWVRKALTASVLPGTA